MGLKRSSAQTLISYYYTQLMKIANANYNRQIK